MKKNDPKRLQRHGFQDIFIGMESNPKLHDTWDAFSHRNLAAEILAAWKRAAAAAGLSRKRKVKSGSGVLGVAAMSGSGFAYPGVISRVPVVYEDGEDDQEDHRTSSVHGSSKSE